MGTAPGYIWHGPGQEVRGREGLRQLVAQYQAAFPDLAVTIEDLVAEGDQVVARWTARGTHQGELMGLAATGQPMSVSAISISRHAAGQIAEEWENFDQLGLLQQLGAVPTPQQAPA